MRLLLLFSIDDITDENSSMNFVKFSLHDLGCLYLYFQYSQSLINYFQLPQLLKLPSFHMYLD